MIKLINYTQIFILNQKCKKSSWKTLPMRRRILKEDVHAEIFKIIRLSSLYHFLFDLRAEVEVLKQKELFY